MAIKFSDLTKEPLPIVNTTHIIRDIYHFSKGYVQLTFADGKIGFSDEISFLIHSADWKKSNEGSLILPENYFEKPHGFIYFPEQRLVPLLFVLPQLISL